MTDYSIHLINFLKAFGVFIMAMTVVAIIGRPFNKEVFKEELEQEKAMNLKPKGWSFERWYFCDILAFPKKNFMD